MDSWGKGGHTRREGAELLTAVGHTWMYARLSGLGAMKRKELWVEPCSVVIEFEERDGEELHVLGDSQNFYGESNV
jgi:hypothetical protein